MHTTPYVADTAYQVASTSSNQTDKKNDSSIQPNYVVGYNYIIHHAHRWSHSIRWHGQLQPSGINQVLLHISYVYSRNKMLKGLF